LRDWVPRSLKRRPEPATKSLTVLDTKTSLRPASAATRAPYVNSDTADIVTDHFALACMKSSTDLDAERLDLIGYGASAADATRRAIKSCKKAIAGRLHLTATEASKHTPDRSMVVVEQVAPALIAEACSLLRRADDIGEQNRRQHAICFNARRRTGEEFLNRV